VSPTTPDSGSDHDALRTLVQRYARAADDRDVEALVALFHPDATVDGARGKQSIAEWLDTMRAPRTFPGSMHVLGDPLIELQGDRATLDTYAVVYQLGDHDAGQADLTLGIRYLDDVVRHDGRWVVRHRVAKTVWMR
jgi:ketosteroid isomerase-like protein